MNLLAVVVLISLEVNIAVGAGSPSDVAQNKLVKELSDMHLKKINHQFNYADFLVKDGQVRQVMDLAISCGNAANSLLAVVRSIKIPLNMKEDKLNDNAKLAYDQCLSLRNHLKALNVGKEITEQKKVTLESDLQFVLDQIEPGNTAPMKELQQLFLSALNNIDKIEDGKQKTEENKKLLQENIQSAIDTLKEIDMNEGSSVIAKKVMQLKNVS